MLAMRLADSDLEIAEIHGLGDEIECAAIHRRAQIGHVAVGRDDDRAHRRVPFVNSLSSVSPSMTGMLMSSSIRSMSGSASSADNASSP